MARPALSSQPQANAASARAPAPSPRAAKSPSLTQRAYDQIKTSILSMELRPGLFLNEAALCEMTGLGRMPVHQAIHKLQADGLIEIIPRKGLVVRSDSLQDILLLIEARLAIEPNIVALAAQRIHDDQVEELQRLLKQSAALINQRQRDSFSAIDRAFHGVVADAARNKILTDTLRPLHERSDLIWHLRIMPADGLKVTQQEHEAVLNAIVARDSEVAWKAMHAHLSSLQKRILKASNL